MKLVKKSVVALGVLSLVLTLHHVESFAKPLVKKASKKVEKTVAITSKKDLTKKFNKNLLKLKGKFSFKISTSVVKNQKALVKVLSTGVKKDAGATVVYKFTKNKKPSVKKTGKFLLVKFNMKYDTKRIYKALALAYEKGFITTKVTRWNEGITKAEGIDLIIKALAEVNQAGILKNGLEVVEGETEETERTGSLSSGSIEFKEGENPEDFGALSKEEEARQEAEQKKFEAEEKKAVEKEKQKVEAEKAVKKKEAEQASKQAEIKKKEAESAKIKSEESDKKALQLKKEAEDAKKQAEIKKTEEARKKAEAAKKKAEESKKEAEQAKKQAEAANKKADEAKKVANKKKKDSKKVDMSGWNEAERQAGRRMTDEERRLAEEVKRQGGELRIDDSWGHPDGHSSFDIEVKDEWLNPDGSVNLDKMLEGVEY